MLNTKKYVVAGFLKKWVSHQQYRVKERYTKLLKKVEREVCYWV